jgi:hypothetical protein
MSNSDKRDVHLKPVARNEQNQIIPMFAFFHNACVNYMQDPFTCYFYKILAPPLSLVISVTGQEGMRTGLKLPFRSSVARAEVTSFILLTFCQHALYTYRNTPTFHEHSGSLLHV